MKTQIFLNDDPVKIDFLENIGPQGSKGESAFQLAKKNGFIGTEEEWLESLKGQRGDRGEKGQQGDPGLKGDRGEKGQQGDPGPKGEKGQPGKEIVSVTTSEEGEISFLFSDGTIYKTVSLTGPKGEKGKAGEKGFSPYFTVQNITNGKAVTVYDEGGSHTFNIYNGQNGFSPKFFVKQISGGHEITVTHIDGSDVFDVMDGKEGHSPIKGIDYWTEQDKQDIINEVLAVINNN